MSAEEFLRLNEKKVLEGEIVSHVKGKGSPHKKKGKLKAFSATAFATLIIIVFVVFFSSGNLIPAAISAQLIEQTDTQYADAVESKILVFRQAMVQGDIPSNTIMRLEEAGVLVGHIENGEFIEGGDGGNIVLKMGEKIITADNFVATVHSDAALYDALNKATYSRASGYYDEAATLALRKIGTSRNNYTSSSDFDEVMSSLVGEGSAIKVDNVTLVEKENEDGEKYYEYETVGKTSSSEAEDFIETVAAKNTATSGNKATLNAASTLNTADKISQEQKSSLFYLAFMENISKMKAGEGKDSKINEAMNCLYEERKSTVIDTETGESIEVSGSMLESPSLYAILSGEKVNTEKTKNYSSDRVLKTIENQLQVNNSDNALSSTVTSTASKVRGSIGRFLDSGSNTAATDTLKKVTPTIESSLVNNSFESIGGVPGGELLVEGAVNVGKILAKASGATAGDAKAVKEYARLNSTILAMDAEVERNTKSPFDITSRNTFLGSIFYKLATSVNYSNTIFKQMSSLSGLVSKSVAAILPTTHADDENNSYLTNFGDCETLGSINAVGAVSCAEIATFDTSTLDDPFNDANFIKFINENTELVNGVRSIKKESVLANFIKFNNEKISPNGVIDGGILAALNNNSSSIPFMSDILTMIKVWLGADEDDKRIASGAAFVNSELNTDWNTYKYAQRYVSLARATAALRQFDGDKTAYNNIQFFECTESPVIAFLNDYYQLANN